MFSPKGLYMDDLGPAGGINLGSGRNLGKLGQARGKRSLVVYC